MTAEGFGVLETANAEDAIEVLIAMHVDLILLDINMPCVAKSIAKVHYGDINVQSVVGKGARFAVTLPLVS